MATPNPRQEPITSNIPLPLSSAPGESPGEGAGRLINAYAEALQPTASSQQVIKRVPGLDVLTTAPQTGCRGFLEVNGAGFAVIGTQLVTFDSTGALTVIGNVAGTKRVYMARNNKKPSPDMVFVSENGAFVFTSTTIAAYPDPDLPQPIGVDFQDGFFFFPIADGRIFASDLNDTAVNALSFATAESKPDGLYRAIPWDNQMLFFGPYSMEVWVDTANTPPAFPYSRSTSKSRGLVAPNAIAGHEAGFGGASLCWVADHNRVVQLQPGYAAVDVSSPDLDRLIEQVADKTTLEASVYVAGGVPRWVLSSPTWTWELNLNTMRWNERASFQISRWTAACSVFAFGKWLVGDSRSGNVYTVDPKTRKEGANPLRYRVESGLVGDFPNRTRVARADFDLATGVGDAAGTTSDVTDPVGEVSYSDDGGSNWSPPQQVPLGQQGKPATRITLTRQGSAGPRGRRWRLDVSDPVYVGLTKGTQSNSLRHQ